MFWELGAGEGHRVVGGLVGGSKLLNTKRGGFLTKAH